MKSRCRRFEQATCSKDLQSVISALQAESPTVSAGGNSRVPLKKITEKCGILVSDCVADLLDGTVIAEIDIWRSSSSRRRGILRCVERC